MWDVETRCSRDNYPESYITKYTSIRRQYHRDIGLNRKRQRIDTCIEMMRACAAAPASVTPRRDAGIVANPDERYILTYPLQ